MPTTTRTNRVEVSTTGEITLDELEDFCAQARREHIPGTTVARLAALPGGGQNIGLVHDFAAPHLADAPTQVMVAPSIRPRFPVNGQRQPSVGDLQ